MNITPVCPKHWRYRGNYFIFCKRVVFSVLFHSTQKSLLQYEQMCDIVALHHLQGAVVGILAFHRGRCIAPKQSRIFDNFIARAGKLPIPKEFLFCWCITCERWVMQTPSTNYQAPPASAVLWMEFMCWTSPHDWKMWQRSPAPGATFRSERWNCALTKRVVCGT